MKKPSAATASRLSTRPDTKQAILDAAEIMLAARGYHATSLRAVTRAAKVNLAAVHYHFGSKQALLAAVIARRLTPLNAQRQAAMAALPAGADASAVWRAFIEPTLVFRDSSPGARHFIAIVGRAIVDADGTVRNVFLEQMQGMLDQLIERLGATLPQLDRTALHWRLFFALGAVAHTLRLADKVPAMTGGAALVLTTPQLVDQLTRFVAAGMEAS